MSEALERIGLDDLRLAYARLAQAHAAQAAFLLEHRHRQASFERRSDLVAGALDAARSFLEADAGDSDTPDAGEAGSRALEAADNRLGDRFKEEIATARSAFATWTREEGEGHAEALLLSQAEVLDLVERLLMHTRPALRLEVASFAGGKQAVVHLQRPTGDEAVLLCARLAGRPPEHYGFLEEEVVEAVDEVPALALSLPGIDPAAVRAGGAEAEDALSHGSDRPLLPIRLHLPLTDPILGWPRLRLLTRGSILELQSREEGEPYTHLLPAAHAERFTGYLVALQAKGEVEVEVLLG